MVGTARLEVIVGRSGLGIGVNQGLADGLISLEESVVPCGSNEVAVWAVLRRVAEERGVDFVARGRCQV